ncbi:hypothetical protein [Prosthecobacter sp.]|uniref:hypothetical protein n=1 Tax=Prosthecobacter sp. TaxID=1965333 RepID=UPI00378386A1
MNPNPDPFENALGALRRRELPTAWRDEMLQTATTAAATAPAAPRTARTPRWLVAGWSLAWAATVILFFGTPAEEAPQSTALSRGAAPALLWQQRAAQIEALLAAN